MLMKAILVSNKSIKLITTETPTIKSENEVLIEVKAVGLCGSDIHRIRKIQENSISNFTILGHEIAGKVVETGKRVKSFSRGDRVVVEPLISCSKCYYCKSGNYQLCTKLKSLGKDLNGGFAEYVIVPACKAFKLEKKTSYEEGVLFDPLAVCIHTFNLAEGIKDHKVAIIGDGTIGRICLQLAEYYQVQNVTIIGKHIKKRDFTSKKIHVINFNRANKLNNLKDYFDVVFESVGRKQSETLNLAIDLVKPKGKIIVLGVFPENYKANLSVRKLFIKEGEIIGSNSYGCYKGKKEVLEALEILNKNVLNLKQLITHTLPLSQFEKGIKLFENKETSKAIKIVFLP